MCMSATIAPNLFVYSPFPNPLYKRRSVDSCFLIFVYYFAFKRLPDFCSKCKNDFVYKQVCGNLIFNIFT
jgi:hypothetical protein